jgi:hypothetical protein
VTRRKLDFYETNRTAVESLMQRVNLGLHVLEPCSGRGAISDIIAASTMHPTRALRTVTTNDINPEMPSERHGDACDISMPSRVDVVTNPPFNEANRIVPHFVHNRHRCAFLLRLSWLEPTKARARFLVEHPLSGLIVLPRYSFTGDGKTDSVTAAWMLWGFDPIGVVVAP